MIQFYLWTRSTAWIVRTLAERQVVGSSPPGPATIMSFLGFQTEKRTNDENQQKRDTTVLVVNQEPLFVEFFLYWHIIFHQDVFVDLKITDMWSCTLVKHNIEFVKRTFKTLRREFTQYCKCDKRVCLVLQTLQKNLLYIVNPMIEESSRRY